MSHYALHAHDLDPRRCTGIARYAAELTAALRREAPADSVTLAVAAGLGVDDVPHTEIASSRRALYLRWLTTRAPRFESLVPGAQLLHATAPIMPIPTRLPLVVTIHDVLPRTHPQWYSRKELYLFELALAWAERRAGAVIVPTEVVAEQLVAASSLGRERIHVTGEGSSRRPVALADAEELIRPLGVSPGSYVVHVGSVSERKNLDTLIEAWPEDGPGLLLVGPDGVGADRIHRLLAGSPRIRAVGAQPDRVLGALMQLAVALVHPSHIEGFGLTPLEAMSLGTPVFTRGDGAVGEVVGDAGFHPVTFDAAAWRNVLEALGDNAALEAMAEAGVKRSRDWTWELAAARTLTAYRSAL